MTPKGSNFSIAVGETHGFERDVCVVRWRRAMNWKLKVDASAMEMESEWDCKSLDSSTRLQISHSGKVDASAIETNITWDYKSLRIVGSDCKSKPAWV